MGDEKKTPDHDMLFLHSRREDGEGFNALRSRPGSIEAATIVPIEEGRDVSRSEVISLKPREDAPLLYDVETLYKGETKSRSKRGGPARFNSSDYIENWSRIFSSGKTDKKMLN